MARKRLLLPVITASILAGILTLTACSSSSKSSTSGSTSSSGSSTSSSGSSASGSGSDAVAAAKAIVAAATVAPTTITAAKQPAFTPKSSGYIYVVGCLQSYASCKQLADVVVAGIHALGYKSTVCDAGASADAPTGCFTNAVNAKPDAIISVAVSYIQSANGYALAKAAHIPVIGAFTGNKTDGSQGDSEVAANACGAEGALQADAVIADSNGKAHPLLLTNDAAGCSIDRHSFFEAEYKKLCPSCKLTKLAYSDTTYATTLGPQLQGALGRDPSINYVVAGVDLLAAIAIDQINQAGKSSSITVLGTDEQPAQIVQMKQKSNMKYDAIYGRGEAGWATVDAAARLMAGQTVAHAIPVNVMLLDQNNVAALCPTSAGWEGPAGYQDQFKKLWGKA